MKNSQINEFDSIDELRQEYAINFLLCSWTKSYQWVQNPILLMKKCWKLCYLRHHEFTVSRNPHWNLPKNFCWLSIERMTLVHCSLPSYHLHRSEWLSTDHSECTDWSEVFPEIRVEILVELLYPCFADLLYCLAKMCWTRYPKQVPLRDLRKKYLRWSMMQNRLMLVAPLRWISERVSISPRNW